MSGSASQPKTPSAFECAGPVLARIPAAVHFVSYEPAIAPLGAVDIGRAHCLPNWIICGGESGGRARLMHPTWSRDVRDQCRVLGIAFFHKQWGTYRSNPLVQEDGLSLAEAERRDPRSNGKGRRIARWPAAFPCQDRQRASVMHPCDLHFGRAPALPHR
jgi:hypothetical protein